MNNIKTVMLLALMTALFMGLGFLIGGRGGAIIALLLSAAMNLFAIWNADKMVLRMHRAREVDARSAPEFVGLVRDLAGRAGLAMPRVFIVDSPHPNAFATGRSPERAAVAATSGLLQLLDRDEVEAVMAHELGHVRNRDTLLMTLTATLAGAISMLGNFAFFFGGENRNPLALIGAIIVAPLLAMLMQMGISRTREYGADRAGAEISGKPLKLASALGKLSRGAARIPNPVAARNPAAAQLYIVEPPVRRGMDNLFSTHPNPANRIAALQAMAGEMPAAVPAPAPSRRTSALGAGAPPRRRASALDPHRNGR